MSAAVRAGLRDARKLFHISWPLIVNNLFNIGVNVADTLMAGHLGATQLAAVALGSSIWITVFLGGLGVVMAIGPIVAQHYGAGRSLAIGHTTHHGIWIAVILALIVIALMQQAERLMLWMNIDPVVAVLAQGYLDALSWGVLGCYWYHCIRQLNEGVGRTIPIMIVMGTSLPINISLNYVFMYGKFGAPALGAVGAGLGSGITFWLMFVFIALYTRYTKHYAPYQLWSGVQKFDLAVARHVLAVGLPIGASFVLQAGLFTVVALIMGSFGTTAVAAHAVTLNYISLVFMVPLGVGMGTTALVGQAIGRGQPLLARRIGFVAMLVALLLMCVSGSLTIIFATEIVHLYSRDEALVSLATTLLMIAAVLQLGDGTQVVAAGALRGLKDTQVPLLINASVYWGVGFVLSLVLGIRFAYGAPGVWIGLCCSLWLAAFLLVGRFHRITKRQRTAHAS